MVLCLSHRWQSDFDARSWQPEISSGFVAWMQQKSAGNDESTMALKPMDRVI